MYAGRRNLFLLSQSHNLDYYNSDQQVIPETMETEVLFPEISRSLYPDIEPYNTGFLKVSEIHIIYYEQSGNPDGHVSFHYLSMSFVLAYHLANTIRFIFV